MKFDELRKLYTTWADTRWERYIQAVRFTRRFCEEFRKHLDAPEFYLDEDHTKKEYIELVGVNPLNDHLKYTLSQSDAHQSFAGHVSEDEREGLTFGISVRIDRSPNHWPKQMILFYRFSFHPVGDIIELFVFQKPFRIDITSPETWSVVFEYMDGLLVRDLTTFGPPPPEKQAPYQIGFGYTASDPGNT